MGRILVIGGYGGFGARVATLLGEAGHEVIVAGRDRAKADEFCRRHPGLALRPLALDRARDLAGPLSAERPWLVIDAAGPFQGADYRVPRACIAAGCHYLDLADARGFVTGIVALDAQAKAAGVTLIAGASSVPALSAAVVDRLAAGMTRVSEIDMALSASNRASGGVSVTRAILSYVGKPVRLWRGQAWRHGFGWQDMGKVRFAVPGKAALRRRVALCEVPDLELLPDRYPGRPAVRFRAGTELEIQNIGLWLLSWPVRWGWLRGLAGLTAIAVRVQKLLGRIGGDRSAMRVVVSGWRDDAPLRREWTVLAEQGDGPWIPALAAPLITARLAEGLPRGAGTAAGCLALADFERAFAAFAITTATAERRPAPLYARLMGEDFGALPATIRAMHEVNGDLGARGTAQVTRGSSLPAKIIGWAFGFPPSAKAVPVTVWMHERDGAETWLRDFGGKRFSSRMSQQGTYVVERFGLVRFAMELIPTADGLAMPFRRWWIGPLPMPRFLLPRGTAREYEADGRFHFDVPIALPLIGPLVHYRGWLTLPAEASGGCRAGSARSLPTPAA